MSCEEENIELRGKKLWLVRDENKKNVLGQKYKWDNLNLSHYFFDRKQNQEFLLL